ncbi:hypothetical protein OIU76_006899 [Salix suchowensis]|nr:hypothetical protein OIU76_006899 [Salix suchowensis]
MKFQLRDVTVCFPYDHIYPEQYSYMVELKRALDAKGHCLLEMPTGTGKTIALLSLITSYTLSLNPQGAIKDSVDAACRKRTVSWVRALSAENPNIETCEFLKITRGLHLVLFCFQGLYSSGSMGIWERERVVSIFLARHMVQLRMWWFIVTNTCLIRRWLGLYPRKCRRNLLLCLTRLTISIMYVLKHFSVSVRRQTLDGASRNISRIEQEINRFKATDANRLRDEYKLFVNGLALSGNLPGSDSWLSNPALPDDILREANATYSLTLYYSPVAMMLLFAIKPVFDRFQSVVITSGTLSPIDLYPRLLNFHPVVSRSFKMSLTRDCICPMVLTRGSDQLPVSTKFDMRSDPGVVRNYGKLLVEMVSIVPDGIVCFFVSYSYMDGIINTWNESGLLKDVLVVGYVSSFHLVFLMILLFQEIMQHKLVFIETQDVVETTLALDNYRRACDCGRGVENNLVMIGVIAEGGFLTFDALRQAAQCVGRVIRSKADYGMMIFADKRYSRHDKRLNCLFLRKMAQPYDKTGSSGKKTLLSQEDLEKMGGSGLQERLY